ncbi:MAG: MFS transporter [Eubacterium sp.]|nr:MFS transporter [Eubacterium sp.]
MKMNRWFYAVVGVIVLLFSGLVYAWSVLAAPIARYYTEWSSAQLSMTFTICMMFFCLGGLFAGILSGKINVKINMVISAVLFLAGFILASRATSLMQLYIGYGALAGMGAGFSYNTVMGSISKFFPDKPGLISGILLMGFGMGSFLIGKVYQAYTGEGEAFRTSFLFMGILLFVVVLASAVFIRKPLPEELKAYQKETSRKEVKSSDEGADFTTLQMIKRSSFWLYFVWAVFLSAAGLALISQASAVVTQVNPAAAAGTVSTVVGLISIFNGCGRVIFGGMFDKIGRVKTMLADEALFILALILLVSAVLLGNFVVLIVAFIIMGLAYGGVTPTNSAYVNAFYGKTNYSVNFSIINMNLLIASFGSTIAGILYDASGSYLSTFLFMLALVVAGSVCAALIKRP